MNQSRKIARAAELESLPVFREWIDSVCKCQPGIDEQAVYDMKLAVDEACTNIITHGYAGIDPGSIILEIDLDQQRARITLTDFGHSFEPSETPMPDVEAGLEDRPTGGFGLFFIYQAMDEIDYEASECGNQLTLVKRFSPVRQGDA